MHQQYWCTIPHILHPSLMNRLPYYWCLHSRQTDAARPRNPLWPPHNIKTLHGVASLPRITDHQSWCSPAVPPWVPRSPAFRPCGLPTPAGRCSSPANRFWICERPETEKVSLHHTCEPVKKWKKTSHTDQIEYQEHCPDTHELGCTWCGPRELWPIIVGLSR